MNNIFYQVLLPLLAAHFLCDFILQTDNDVKKRKSIVVFSKHIVLITLLSYLFTGYWSDFTIPLVILLSHTIIDLLKRSIKRDSIAVFLADQTAHLLVIMVLSFYVLNKLTMNIGSQFWFEVWGSIYLKVLVLTIALIIITKFSGIIISYIIKPFQAKIIGLENNDGEGIKTGRLIGYLERLIILVLFLSGLPAVVGFLITAKSILRYGEIKNQKDKIMIEYVLIGTLLSFGLGISIAFITTKFLSVLN